MPTFRQRPLTWLFVIATAAFDVASWARGAYETELPEELVHAQLMVLGGWLALGRSPLLVRSAAAVAVVAATIVPDLFMKRVPKQIGYVLAESTAIVAVTAVAALVFRLLLGRFDRGHGSADANRWRLSILELLGWMTIIAGAATVLRTVESEYVMTADDLGEAVAAFSGGGFLMALWLRASRLDSRWKLAISILAMIGLGAGISLMRGSQPDRVLAILFGYVIAWIAVQRMDEARLAKLSPANEPSA